MNKKFHYIASALDYLPSGTVIDGELVAMGPDGHPDFNLLQSGHLDPNVSGVKISCRKCGVGPQIKDFETGFCNSDFHGYQLEQLYAPDRDMNIFGTNPNRHNQTSAQPAGQVPGSS